MFAKINHMAMVSPIYPMLANFYEAFFGLKRSGKTSRPLNAVTVGDGYVGLNINPLRDGYVGGLDHFGLVVDDIDLVLERARSKFPQANIVKRPSTRPFANTAPTIRTATSSISRRRMRATSWSASMPSRRRKAGTRTAISTSSPCAP